MPKNDIQKQGRILMLPVDCIEPSPYQARTAFDEPEIAALAVSILQNGLLQPISVRRVGIRKYQLVAGERRLRACRKAVGRTCPAPAKAAHKNMLCFFYKKHSIFYTPGKEKSFARLFCFLRCYNGFFAIFPPFRG